MLDNHSVMNSRSNMEIAQSNQDLITSKNKRKKRNWLIATVVLFILLTLIITAIIIIQNTPGHHDKAALQFTAPTINLEEFLNYKYTPKSFNGTWVSGHELLYTNSDGNLILFDVSNGSSRTLLYSHDSIMLTAFNFQFSADRNYLLVAHDYQKLYRHSYKARYTLIHLTTGNRTILRLNPNIDNIDLLLVEWAPVGNALAYIFENNIYYKPSVESNQTIQITNTTGFIINGMPDWVYEEEVFSSNKALWFSSDGKKLAFIRFNDTETPIMVVPVYGEPGSLYFQYPRANIIKYPKAGTANPTVQLFIVTNLETVETMEMEVPKQLQETQPLLTAITWTTSTTLVAVWMNRVQNQSAIVAYQSGSTTPTIIKYITESNGWVELFVPPKISKDGSQLALILPKFQSKLSGSFRHVALLDVKENAKERFITSGEFTVTEILGWNTNDNLIYYTATFPNDSSVQHVFSISPATTLVKCLSCQLKSKNLNIEQSIINSTDCLYNSADVSTDASYLSINCGGPNVPYVTLLSKDGTKNYTWTENEELVNLLANKLQPKREVMEFPIDNGFTARVLLKLPPNFDSSGRTKYPMIVNVYGGPDTNQVTQKFSMDWGSYLAANKSFIYATIDGRGSGLRGSKLLYASYRKLGTTEVIDQVNVTRLLHQRLPYVDATKTAIWGWSYGGYAAGMALATDTNDVFKCGISVAPVTDWTLYDSIYTERFMGLPTPNDNLIGYTNGQLLKKYAGLKNKMYFLIHGTFDDNVHYQQSMMWAKMLERNDILFRQLSYTDEDHSLGSVRPHLYHSLENFLNECFEK